MFLMLPAPPGLDSQNPTIPYVYGGLKVAVTPAFSSTQGKEGGVDASPPSEPGSAGSPAGEHGSKRGAFYQKGNETVQATIWGMSSPATSVKRMFRPL